MKKIIILLISILAITFSGCTGEDGGNQMVNGAMINIDNNQINKNLIEVAITTGPVDAEVSIIEVSDFECPACRYWHPQFEKVIEKYIDRVQFGYIVFPLSYHTNSKKAAYAFEAAKMQNKGVEMYKKMFEGQDLLIDKLEDFAQELELDMDRFRLDMQSQKVKDAVDRPISLLSELNIQGTPTYYINGVEYSGTPTVEDMSAQIDEILGL